MIKSFTIVDKKQKITATGSVIVVFNTLVHNPVDNPGLKPNFSLSASATVLISFTNNTFKQFRYSTGNSYCSVIINIRQAFHFTFNKMCGRPPQYALAHFDLESGVRVMCDVGYLYANFSLPKPLRSRLRPDVRDRQTSYVKRASSLNASAPSGKGHNKWHNYR